MRRKRRMSMNHKFSNIKFLHSQRKQITFITFASSHSKNLNTKKTMNNNNKTHLCFNKILLKENNHYKAAFFLIQSTIVLFNGSFRTFLWGESIKTVHLNNLQKVSALSGTVCSSLSASWDIWGQEGTVRILYPSSGFIWKWFVLTGSVRAQCGATKPVKGSSLLLMISS